MVLGTARGWPPRGAAHAVRAGPHRQEGCLALFGKADDAGPPTVLASVHRIATLEVTASPEPCDGHEGTLGVMLCSVADSL